MGLNMLLVHVLKFRNISVCLEITVNAIPYNAWIHLYICTTSLQIKSAKMCIRRSSLELNCTQISGRLSCWRPITKRLRARINALAHKFRASTCMARGVSSLKKLSNIDLWLIFLLNDSSVITVQWKCHVCLVALSPFILHAFRKLPCQYWTECVLAPWLWKERCFCWSSHRTAVFKPRSFRGRLLFLQLQ